MRRFFGKVINNNFVLDDEDFKHLAVLRFGVNDEFLGICGDEYEYTCKITKLDKKSAICTILSKELCKQNPKKNITLFQALPKADKLELITQKITELGATDLVIFNSEFSVAKANINKLARLNKISVEACKQCGRTIPLKIHDILSFDDMLYTLDNYDLVLFAYEKQKDIIDLDLTPYKNIAIIIGSEGGFSQVEVKRIYEHKAVLFGLGKRILRCETSAIFAVGLVSYKIDN